MVVTISREKGSGGETIAREVARELGYRFIDKAFLTSVFREYGLAAFDREYESSLGFWDHFNRERAEERDLIVDLLNRVVLALARAGNVVIMGRGIFAVLGGYTDVLNVRVQAPLGFRIDGILDRWTRQGKPADRARAEADLLRNDSLREEFTERFYKVRGDLARGFDLVLDTSKVSNSLAVKMITETVRTLPPPLPGAQTTESIDVEEYLKDTVDGELEKLKN